MSDDEVDLGLLAFLRQHYAPPAPVSAEDAPETGVLADAERVVDDAVDVALVMSATKRAAAAIHMQMEQQHYSPASWAEHELHPRARDESTVDFIFTMDLLNFSFWSEKERDEESVGIEYGGVVWRGYWSLVAALRRAVDEGV